jgi:homogentisate phytyltransferase/homogentisate geranylgeranyltransferase
MNLYITGLNQLFDVEIDRINKPTLPLASGELSIRAGAAIVAVALAAALCLSWAHWTYCSFALRVTLVGSALLGTAYSVPPFRLKRFPVLAAICIIGVRGALVNWGFITHASTVLQAYGFAASGPMVWPPVVFFSLFGAVIAIVKDVPDVTGDAMFGIRSFSVRFSPVTVLNNATILICGGFCAAAGALGLGAAGAATGMDSVRRGALAVLALLTARVIWRRKALVDADDRVAVYSFYMWLWRCFYGAYLALPFAR